MPIAFEQLGLLGWASLCDISQGADSQLLLPNCIRQSGSHVEASELAYAATGALDMPSATPGSAALQIIPAAAQQVVSEAEFATAPQINLPALIGDRYLGDVGVKLVGNEASIDVERLVVLIAPELTACRRRTSCQSRKRACKCP